VRPAPVRAGQPAAILLNIHGDKKFQKSNWLRRPLPTEALDYAARDTASLHALKDILARRLAELGRMDWAREEFLAAEGVPTDLAEDTTPAPLPHQASASCRRASWRC